MIKRIFDLLVSIMLLTLLFPVIALTALLIFLKLGSPVLFKQKRPGLYGKPFYIFKFRTMTEQRDEQGDLLQDNLRLTPLGTLIRRLSLDELPQLYCVIKGDISIVGPRPLLMEYLPLYSLDQARRHEVKPGITGWAQVNGRNAISWEEKFVLDVWYVDNRSFWLDLKIIWLTVLKVIKSEGINQQGQATVDKFRGVQS
ncbi:MAG: sugar transferase [Firmicutes bacterium]|nr:sugar transferase [Bacillota bacterium]